MSSTLRRALAAAGVTVGALATVLAVAGPANAEAIDSIGVDARVNADTTVSIAENINYDFQGAQRHGIYRDIPVYDEDSTGRLRNYRVSVDSVSIDGQAVPYELQDNGQYLRVKIGDPNFTISGKHTYVIDYTVANGLRVISAQDMTDPQMPAGISQGDVEFYWDLVGTQWEVPFYAAQGRVTGPAAPLSAKCLYGSAGGNQTCAIATDGATSLTEAVSLSPRDALTVVVAYPRSAFTATPVEDFSNPLPAGLLIGIGSLLGLLALGIPMSLAIAWRRRDKGVDLPAAPPQYSAPDDVAPAELAAAWKGRTLRTDPRMLVATLVDLAARGWVRISTDPVFTVTYVGPGQGTLRAWEQQFLNEFFMSQSVVVMQGYDATRTAVWHSTFDDRVDDALRSGRRNPEGGKPDQRWNWLLLIAFGSGGLAFLLNFMGLKGAPLVLVPVAVGAFVGFGVARLITPRSETQQSAVFLAKINGLQKVLDTDPAAARRELAQRLNLAPAAVMATMLPFAIVFGLEQSWLAAFPDLSEQDLAATGLGFYSLYAIDNMINSATHSISTATTAPSSGSGGGGFSGGGGGGGGGGSW